jgi:hypothetical protein
MKIYFSLDIYARSLELEYHFLKLWESHLPRISFNMISSVLRSKVETSIIIISSNDCFIAQFNRNKVWIEMKEKTHHFVRENINQKTKWKMERKEPRKQGYKIKPYTSFRLLLIKTRNMRLTYKLPHLIMYC